MLDFLEVHKQLLSHIALYQELSCYSSLSDDIFFKTDLPLVVVSLHPMAMMFYQGLSSLRLSL